ncbi:MAG: hypothetical protein ACP5OZ_03050 [Candidatus Woesearchaeota archaeon]
MIFKNKKFCLGKSGSTVLAAINFIPKMVLLTLVLLTAWIFVYNFLSSQKDISKLKSFVETQKLIYSKEISFYDGSTYHPGIIELENFNIENLNKIFYFEYNKYMSMKLSIKTKDGNVLKEIIFNDERYQDMLTRSYFSGKGSTKRNIMREVIIVKDKDKFYNAVLEVEILMEQV